MGLLDWWFAGGEAEKSAALDEQLDKLNREALRTGKISQAEYERRAGKIADGLITGEEIADAFGDEILAQAAALPDTVKEALEAPVGWGLRAVPWWAWVGLALWALSYVGAGRLAKGSLYRILK